MAILGLVVHEGRDPALVQARELGSRLSMEGHEVRWLTEVGEAEDLDLVVSLGGDGSILRAVNLLDGLPVPVLGVNFGQLGYLTACEPDEVDVAVGRVLRGEYALEERMMLAVQVRRVDGTALDIEHGLNELVVERTGHTIRLGLSFDGSFFTSYAADGLIVATPTGSTAYAFSARGPIVDAMHRSLQLTPVSAHMLFDRTLVVSPDTEISLEILGDRPAMCTVDGREGVSLARGDLVVCTASDRIARLVTFGGSGFEMILKAKFGLEDR